MAEVMGRRSYAVQSVVLHKPASGYMWLDCGSPGQAQVKARDHHNLTLWFPCSPKFSSRNLLNKSIFPNILCLSYLYIATFIMPSDLHVLTDADSIICTAGSMASSFNSIHGESTALIGAPLKFH
ncbi:hypothetical protein GLAREA_04657 [Glarea lozoyensis ATCC 20868]|uniref:Uncharacterized protein n=1 Tax=Glarea lozoyensis (strain ATCC 20868 / MF5171) TaxID=1116229 RepID=S3D786_GLAL2|nr:uncharacterized protein GLAREA_04657 [Glarea lozoyensis ATCC 20868]EPE27866.1 hypothetical protein GLAREA_04657 [Glarea lozoyensis ATCC 20868]